MRAVAAVTALAVAIGASAAGADEIVFDHVTVVDVAAGRLLPDQAVRVSGARIVEVAPSAVTRRAPGARTIDARGKFLMPGLWDMHAHHFSGGAPGCPEITFALDIAHGVTGARDVAAHLDYLLAWRAEIDAGRVTGPRSFGTGPLVDGVPPVYPPISVVARTPDDARRIVDALGNRGADFVKVYEMLGRDAFLAVMEQAKKRQLPVAAHVPFTVLAGEASDAGVRSFEHLRNLDLACSRDAEALLAERTAMLEAGAGRIGAELRSEIHSRQRARALETHDPQRCGALLRKLAANGTWQTPTLYLETRQALRPDLRSDVRDTLRWVPRRQRAEWESWSKQITALAPEAAASHKRHADWAVGLVARMKQEGVGLLAGTDMAIPWVVPGAAVHEELQSLVGAGLTPLEALRTATWNAAAYFGRTDEFGAVAAGRYADLVLVDADPLADIRNARRTMGVVVNGRYLDRAALDSMLADAERLAGSGEHDTIHRPGRIAAVR